MAQFIFLVIMIFPIYFWWFYGLAMLIGLTIYFFYRKKGSVKIIGLVIFAIPFAHCLIAAFLFTFVQFDARAFVGYQ